VLPGVLFPGEGLSLDEQAAASVNNKTTHRSNAMIVFLFMVSQLSLQVRFEGKGNYIVKRRGCQE
jgi:hypothetical protein